MLNQNEKTILILRKTSMEPDIKMQDGMIYSFFSSLSSL